MAEDQKWIAFLQWALPRLRLRWPGFRTVRGQVIKRIRQRLQDLGLPGPEDYGLYLQRHPEEWRVLDGLCRITISRFYRDRGMYTRLSDTLLPEFAARAARRGRTALRVWCTGCASGEEPYSLVMLCKLRLPDIGLQVLATDTDPHLLQRARTACYPYSSLKDLPAGWQIQAFTPSDGVYCLQPAFKTPVLFAEHDVRAAAPVTGLDLLLCRNLVYTYFETGLQREVTARFQEALLPGGVLVVGSHEQLPGEVTGFASIPPHAGIYRKEPAG